MAFHSKTEACRPDMSKKASSSAHNCAWSAWNTKNSTCPPRSTRLGESTAACPALGTSPPEPSVAHTSYRVCGALVLYTAARGSIHGLLQPGAPSRQPHRSHLQILHRAVHGCTAGARRAPNPVRAKLRMQVAAPKPKPQDSRISVACATKHAGRYTYTGCPTIGGEDAPPAPSPS